jgi:hypothetical protein
MPSAVYSALPIVMLPALVASLGSWLFNQWSNEQRRASALDECYSRVSTASQVAARSGRPPVVSWQ